MKLHYDKREDILMIELLRAKIDHAYERGNMIVHVTKDKEPVLLEIFEASKLFASKSRILPNEIKKRFISPRVS